MDAVVPPPPPIVPASGYESPVRTYRRVKSAAELPIDLRKVYEEQIASGRELEPWQLQPDPPGPLYDSRLPPKLPIGGDLRGYPNIWPKPAHPWPRPDEHGVPACDECGIAHVVFHKGNKDHLVKTCPLHTIQGLPCRGYIVRGAKHCRHHTTKPARKAAKRRLAAEKVLASISEVEVGEVGNPIDRLAELAAEQIAWKDHLASVVGALNDQYRFVDDKGAEQLDARVDLYTKAMAATQKHLLDLTKLGFEEQRLALEERRAALVVEFIGAVLGALGLNTQDPRVKTTLDRFIPMLDGGDVIDVHEVEEDNDEEE